MMSQSSTSTDALATWQRQRHDDAHRRPVTHTDRSHSDRIARYGLLILFESFRMKLLFINVHYEFCRMFSFFSYFDSFSRQFLSSIKLIAMHVVMIS
jgi:hypothetical protein